MSKSCPNCPRIDGLKEVSSKPILVTAPPPLHRSRAVSGDDDLR